MKHDQIPSEVTYLNCAYMGPQSRSVSEIGKKSLIRKELPWQIKPDDFFNKVEELRSACAYLVNCSPDNIALIPSASYGIATASQFVELNRGDEVIVLAEQFPSHVYTWRELCRKRGATLKTVQRPEQFDWTSAILSCCSERTKVLAIPACHWTDGSRIDLKQLKTEVPEAKLIVDGSQYIGGEPFDVSDSPVDALITVGYKWLFGPYSLGFMYVNEEHLDSPPIEYGWLNRKDAEDFARLVDYSTEYAEGARRFDVGEKSNFILVPMFLEALRQVLDVGVEGIARHNSSLLSLLVDEVANAEVIPDHLRSRHMTGLYFKGKDLNALQKYLVSEKIYVSVRGACIRVSPHLYNDESDIRKLVKALDSHWANCL